MGTSHCRLEHCSSLLENWLLESGSARKMLEKILLEKCSARNWLGKNQARKLLDSNFTKSKLRKLYFLYICQDFSIMHAKYHQKLCFLTHESLLTNKKWTKNFAGSSIARARSKNLLLEFGSARKVLENFWLETRLGSKNFGSKCSSHENFGSDPSLILLSFVYD